MIMTKPCDKCGLTKILYMDSTDSYTGSSYCICKTKPCPECGKTKIVYSDEETLTVGSGYCACKETMGEIRGRRIK